MLAGKRRCARKPRSMRARNVSGHVRRKNAGKLKKNETGVSKKNVLASGRRNARRPKSAHVKSVNVRVRKRKGVGRKPKRLARSLKKRKRGDEDPIGKKRIEGAYC